ncbi:hypothetical protein [Deinococcus sp.]|uniref:hypothetical protein n=1 Tax=Deinococcus sp. TaxID=47478 RepID=UPI0025BB706D|nr:hypothetical protein [Deinococcus sp.]
MPLGDPPNYSTPRTLGLALVSMLGALAHFALGAAEYTRIGRYEGLFEMILAGLLLVYGVLTIIRFFEAQDALSDPRPRTPMYATPHEWLTFYVGLGFNVSLALVSLFWGLRGELLPWHALAALINLFGAYLAWQSKPQPD